MSKILSIVIAVMLSTISVMSVQAGEVIRKNVESINKEKQELSGKQVTVKGKVVKVNEGIMGRNFIHIMDYSGHANEGTNKLIATSNDTAAVGDEVEITGNVFLNRDFGGGYSYPLLLEDATVVPAK